MPVLAIGRDIFCDTSAIISAIQDAAGSNKVPTSPADKAYEYFGNTVFWSVLSVIPHEMLTEGFVKDRASIFRMPNCLILALRSPCITLGATSLTQV